MEFLIYGDLRVEFLISDSYKAVYVDAKCLNFVKARGLKYYGTLFVSKLILQTVKILE